MLLVRENYDRYRFSLPGGAIEAGETPEDCVIRETLEETGVDVRVDHVIGTYRLDNGFEAHAFRCSIVAGDPSVPDTGEIAAVEWHDPTALPMPRSNILHYAVPDAIAGRRGISRTGLARIS